MNRRLTKAKLFDLVEKLRAQIPGLVIRTSIIVGFPGETDAEFQELCDDLKALNLDHVGVFSYSKEEGTKAAEFTDQITPNVKRKRKKKLIEILQIQRQEKLAAFIGQEFEVMIEGPAPESDLLVQARLATQAQEIDGRVLINDLGERETENREGALTPGSFAWVKITELAEQDLIAQYLRPSRLEASHRTSAGRLIPGLSLGSVERLKKGVERRNH